MGLFSHAMNKAAQPVLGKFSIKVQISMTISNSAGTIFTALIQEKIIWTATH
jgi:hypothetical protein